MAPELPHDIWSWIASFIPKQHLFTLISVNRALYNIVLDARYREIQWVKLDREMLKTLLRLQEPHIAGRVRRLHIRAWFIQHLLNSLSLSMDGRSQSRFDKWVLDGIFTVSKHLSIFKKTVTPVTTPGLPQFQSGHAEATPARILSPTNRLGLTLSSSSSVVDLMLKAFRRMVNLTEYNMEWRDLPVTKDTRAFLYRGGHPDSNNLSGLCKLALHAQLPKLHELLPNLMYKFSGLQELELHFEYNTPSPLGAPTSFEIARTLALNQTILHRTVAPFIASLGPSLSALTISSSAECNHAHLFNSPMSEAFHRLRSLSVCIPFDSGHLSDTAGIVHLLQTHAGMLLHVEFRQAEIEETAPTSKDLEAWSILNKACLHPSATMSFSCLESLTIPVSDVLAASQLVRRSADTLRNLCLLGNFLDEDGVKEFVNILPNRGGKLKSLSINISGLTPGLMDTLATGLPALRALSLVLRKHDGAYFQVLGERGFKRQDNWNLYDLSIYLGSRSEDGAQSVVERLEDSMIVHLLGFLPRVRSIKGRGSVWPICKLFRR